MKKIVLLSILSYGVILVSYSQQFGWKDISANVPEFEGYTYPRIFTDVFFISDEEGWITTSTSGGASDSSYILHTTNGGETFEMQKNSIPLYFYPYA